MATKSIKLYNEQNNIYSDVDRIYVNIKKVFFFRNFGAKFYDSNLDLDQNFYHQHSTQLEYHSMMCLPQKIVNHI